MPTQKRWIKPMIAEAAVCATKMPWERGAPRKAMIARRQAAAPQSAPKKTA